jgi:hypothetical protein
LANLSVRDLSKQFFGLDEKHFVPEDPAWEREARRPQARIPTTSRLFIGLHREGNTKRKLFIGQFRTWSTKDGFSLACTEQVSLKGGFH